MDCEILKIVEKIRIICIKYANNGRIMMMGKPPCTKYTSV